MDKQLHHPISMPALLRAARLVYGNEIRADLEQAGYDDIPGNGIFVLGAIVRGGAPLSELIQYLGVSKQAAGQLVDSLVLRGYLARDVDQNDRRRLTIRLSERGVAAAKVARLARERIDARLERQVTCERVECARATLMALIQCQAPTGAVLRKEPTCPSS